MRQSGGVLVQRRCHDPEADVFTDCTSPASTKGAGQRPAVKDGQRLEESVAAGRQGVQSSAGAVDKGTIVEEG